MSTLHFFSEELKISALNCEDFKHRIFLNVRQNRSKVAEKVNHIKKKRFLLPKCAFSEVVTVLLAGTASAEVSE